MSNSLLFISNIKLHALIPIKFFNMDPIEYKKRQPHIVWEEIANKKNDILSKLSDNKLYFKYIFTFIKMMKKKGYYYANICGHIMKHGMVYEKRNLNDFINILLDNHIDNDTITDFDKIYEDYCYIKYDSDMIVFITNIINSLNPDSSEIEKYYDIFDKYVKSGVLDIQFEERSDNPIIIQYRIVFNKIDIKYCNMILSIASIINSDYNYVFYNGYDFGESISDHKEYLLKLSSHYNKFNIKPMFTLGNTIINNKETINDVNNGIEICDKISDGLVLVSGKIVETLKKSITIEISPITTTYVNYYQLDKNPMKRYINSDKIKIILCNSLGGLYNTFGNEIIYQCWDLSDDDKDKLMLNGINDCDYKDYLMYLYKNKK